MAHLGTVIGFVLASLPIGAQESQGDVKDLSVPVFYHGSGDLACVVRQKSFNLSAIIQNHEIPTLSDRSPQSLHMLIVEGDSGAEGQLLRDEILAGNPVIITGMPQKLKKEIGAQLDPAVFEGAIPDSITSEIFDRHLSVEAPGELPLQETVFACYLGSDGVTRTFVTTELDPIKAAELAHEWALEAIAEQQKKNASDVSDLSTDVSSSATRGAYWQEKFQRSYSSGDTYKPYCKINIRTIFSKLINDNNSTYDWWDVKFQHQIVPGCSTYGSEYHTAGLQQGLQATYRDPKYFLSTYSPTSTSGTSSVGVNIGVTSGTSGASVTLGANWSYTISSVKIHDMGNYEKNICAWWHEIDAAQPCGTNTYQVQPGATIRVPNGTSAPYTRWAEWYQHQTAYRRVIWYFNAWIMKKVNF